MAEMAEIAPLSEGPLWEIAAGFEPCVEIREYGTDGRVDGHRYGAACRIILDGRLIAAGPLASARAIRSKLHEEFDKLTGCQGREKLRSTSGCEGGKHHTPRSEDSHAT